MYDDFEIDGNWIRIARDRLTQTVNFCRSRQSWGDYRQVYRSDNSDNFVTEGKLRQRDTIEDIEKYLVAMRFEVEGPRF